MTPTARSVAPTTKTEHGLFRNGCRLVAGIDEVGRGAWAGPLAVGVALASKSDLQRLPDGVRDSKLLTERARESLFGPITKALSGFAVGFASPRECDDLGMTRAQALATRRALAGLSETPDAVIVDGPHNFTDRTDAITLIGADRLTLIVAAASIVAKVTRDRMMIDYAAMYPDFGFERNKGYASLQHRTQAALVGITEIHRASWSVAPSHASTLSTSARL